MTPPVFLLKEVETAFIAHLFLLPLRKVPIMRKEMVELVWLPNLVFYKIGN